MEHIYTVKIKITPNRKVKNADQRIYNFNTGPGALPLPVLKRNSGASFLNFNNSGMSITEISHRSSYFDDVINDAVEHGQTSFRSG